METREKTQIHHRLKALRVQFLTPRPKGTIKVVVTQAEGASGTSRKFNKNEDVFWESAPAWSSSGHFVISIWWRPWYIYRRLYARFVVEPTDYSSTTVEYTDPRGRLKLILTFTDTDADAPNAPTDPVEDTERRHQELKAKILAARPKVQDKKVILEKLGKARGLIGYIDTVGHAIGEAHPVAGAAFSVVGLFIKACENQERSREAALDLMGELDAFMEIEASVPELDARTDSRQPVQQMLLLIDEIVTYVSERTKGGYSGDLLSRGYLDKINAFKDDFSKALGSFRVTLQIEIFKGLDAMQQDLKLKKLKPSSEAHFRSSNRKSCLEGTRVNLLEKLSLWSEIPSAVVSPSSSPASHPSSPSSPPTSPPLSPPPHRPTNPLYWLHGAAGTGKSTVAKTFAQDAECRGSPLLCYFCRRDDTDLSDPKRVLPTLAHSLAKQHAGYARALIKVLGDPRYAGIASADVSEQFKVLFQDILPGLPHPTAPFIGVVDAVDESGDTENQRILAKYIWELTRTVPWLTLFVTSRREPKIVEVLKAAGCTVTNIEDEASTADDIRRYITHELSDLCLSAETIDRLVERAAGLFIWCSTLIRFIRQSINPKGTIERVLSTTSENSPTMEGVHKDLYNLYSEVLRLAVPNEVEKPLMWDVLLLVFISSETSPLPTTIMSAFLGVDLPVVQNVIKQLHAVLFYNQEAASDSSDSVGVRVYHNSFRDYLERTLDPARSRELHGIMAMRSLDVLHAELRFNICNLKGKPRLNKDIPNLPSLVTEMISPLLQYSSRFWLHHVSRSGLAPEATADRVARLVCSVKALFYLEVLSLLDALELGAHIFFACTRYFKECSDIVSSANDIERLYSSYSEAMESAAHIYLSAVSWAPTGSHIAQLACRFTHLPLISSDNDTYWDSCIAVRSMGSRVNCVAYCPDGSRFVVGLADGTLRIAVARTGAPISEPLRGHTRDVLSVAWSPDGMWIASGSDDCTVRFWDVQSRAPLGEPLHGHSGWVHSIAFSPDSTRVVSGSDDQTLRIWEVLSGVLVGEPLRGHSGVVLSVAYSPDGTKIASGSADKSIRIWDAESGDAISQPLGGHSDWVRSVRYSPCGTRIVSASDDKTLRIWDGNSGAPVGNPLRGHKNNILSAAFSPDGALVASCGQDCSVRLWDATSHAPLASFQGHTVAVNSLTFSPDCLRLISGSDDGAVRIWDTSSRNVISDFAQGHSGAILSVAYSTDGTRILSGSRDATVRVWDARSGAPVGKPLRGHSDEVRSIAISPDGTRMVSGSRDKTLRIWELQSGMPVVDPLQGHTGSVQCVAYSPDGARIASGSSDHTIRIWDAQSGEPIRVSLQGHSGTVWSIAYSPNGRRIISGSSDKTVRIWNAQSGVPIGEPLTGHCNEVTAVAYSPNGAHIVSASDDDTLRLWDAESGAPIGSPLEGHSDSVLSVSYAPDGRHIASGGGDGTLRIWDTVTGKAIGEPRRVHPGWARSIAYSPDGTHIAWGSSDKTIRISECSLLADERWRHCVSGLDEQNGWVRDGEDILLWMPSKYRERLRNLDTIVIGDGVLKPRTPVVNLGEVWRCAGEGWAEIFNGLSD